MSLYTFPSRSSVVSGRFRVKWLERVFLLKPQLYDIMAKTEDIQMAESSSAGARNGLKPQTNGAAANYELPW